MLPRNEPTEDQIIKARMYVNLRPSEAVTVLWLALNPGERFSPAEIAALVNSRSEDTGQAAGQIVKRLRTALWLEGIKAQINTLYGSGYWMDAKSAKAVMERLA